METIKVIWEGVAVIAAVLFLLWTIVELSSSLSRIAQSARDLVTAWFQREVVSEFVDDWAKINGYESALIDDLLAVGAHPEHGKLQLQFPIVALGSSAVVDGSRRVPYLDGGGSERYLRLDYRDPLS